MKKCRNWVIILSIALVITTFLGGRYYYLYSLSSGDTVVQDKCPDPPLTIPIDRVRLKRSPRAILTWNAEIEHDTLADYYDLGKIKAVSDGSVMRMSFTSATGEETPLFEVDIVANPKTQIGAYAYRFDATSRWDHLVFLVSTNDGEMEAKVFKMKSDSPFAEMVISEPDRIMHISPIPFVDFRDKSIIYYNSEMYNEPIKAFTVEEIIRERTFP